MTKTPRVFIGVTEVAGFYRALKYGYDQLGIPCTYMNIIGHRFQYGGDRVTRLVDFIRQSAQKKGKFWRATNKLARMLLFTWALMTHDVFIFGFNSSFFKNYADLPILKLFGKKIAYQFHGSDSRPPFMDGSVMAPARKRSIEDCITMTARKKRLIQVIDRHADLIVNTPPQGLFHQRPFALWMRMGVAVLPPEQQEILPGKTTGPPFVQQDRAFRLLHCPSDPEAKGSQRIRDMVRSLQAKGLNLELVELTDQPNAVVCQALQDCDIVLDQLYADYGMPGFATEAAWYGKPVIIGGYAVDLWKKLLPEECIPPTYYCHPDQFESAIEELATSPEARQTLGLKARHFVETQWHPSQIAARYLALLNGQVPEGWMYDPQDIRYWQGCCLEEKQAQAMIHNVLQAGGLDAFQLQDKPDLQRLIQKIATRKNLENKIPQPI